MTRIAILGATGSIGTQTLDLVRLDQNFKLTAFSFGKNVELAKKIIDEFQPSLVSGLNQEDCNSLKKLYPYITFLNGDEGLIKVATYENADAIVNALVGSVGLKPTYMAIKSKKDIYLANKETLVIGGELIMQEVKKNNVNLYPLDSEHSAIFQLLDNNNEQQIRRLIITASGGSLRDLKRNELNNVTKEQVLNHPNWEMGPKITVDSASMMNKGFEVIEAHYLFNIDIDNIDVLLHRSSIVHSMVEFNDGSICAQMASPDMHLPIHYALYHKIHSSCDIIKRLPLNNLYNLEFSPLDNDRFPLVEIAKKTLKLGGIYPCILNASNEMAVQLFLNDKIKFNEIEEIIINELNNREYDYYKNLSITIELLLEVDELVKSNVKKRKD